jgi:hypothetical protein
MSAGSCVFAERPLPACLPDLVRVLGEAAASEPALTLVRADRAEAVTDLLLSGRWRRGGADAAEFGALREDVLHRVRHSIRRDAPLVLTLMAFPFKVPNVVRTGGRRHPDLAEVGALLRLARLSQAVRRLHAPGIELHLISDGEYIRHCFDVEAEAVSSYAAAFDGLARQTGVRTFTRTHEFANLLGRSGGQLEQDLRPFRREALTWVRSRRGTSEWRLRFRQTLGMLALPHLEFPARVRLESDGRRGWLERASRDVRRRVLAAMVEYRARDALLHEHDPRPRVFPTGVHLTIQRRPGRLGVWLLRRGRGTPPWHGVGLWRRGEGITVGTWAEISGSPAWQPLWVDDAGTPFGYVASEVSAPAA